jgi:hypothetical protein
VVRRAGQSAVFSVVWSLRRYLDTAFLIFTYISLHYKKDTTCEHLSRHIFA